MKTQEGKEPHPLSGIGFSALQVSHLSPMFGKQPHPLSGIGLDVNDPWPVSFLVETQDKKSHSSPITLSVSFLLSSALCISSFSSFS